MNAFINKTFAVAALITASTVLSFSQTRTVEHDFSPFDGIEASDGFKVTIAPSETYSAKLTVDDALESYVECYVKAGVLHIGLDEKSIPKDLKKQYKGKNATGPTLVAYVYLPALKSLTLNDDSEFHNTGNLTADSFSMSLSGTSAVNNLKIVAKSVELSLVKNAKLTNASISAEGDVTLSGDGKCVVTLECAARNLTVSGAGSSDLSVNGESEKRLSVETSGSAKIAVSGKAGSLEVGGKGGSAKVDASGLKVDTASIAVSGSTVDVAPNKSLELDLGKGAEVNYSGDPTIKIVKIVSSSVTRK